MTLAWGGMGGVHWAAALILLGAFSLPPMQAQAQNVRPQEDEQQAALLQLFASTAGNSWQIWQQTALTKWGAPGTSYCRCVTCGTSTLGQCSLKHVISCRVITVHTNKAAEHEPT